MTALVLTLLLLAVLASAISAIYARHASRTLFIELQSLVDGRDRLNIEWGRLQIEQSTWASPARIEQMATSRLGMRVPDPSQVVIVQP
jgi:cell division protein FtsL